MRILLYRDATLECPLRAVANGLARVFASSEVSVGQELVELPGQLVRLDSYPALPRALRAEAASADLAVIGTTKRYENNYFYESNDPVAIVVSFANWDSLTSLPVSNGLVLFVAQLVAHFIRFGSTHASSRGCLNDFRQNKRDIDFGMRAAFVCRQCMSDFESSRPSTHDRTLAREIGRLLDDLSHASRANSDIIEYWKTSLSVADTRSFDVFLCHNSADKQLIRQICSRLKTEGIRPWLDEEQLRPGTRWQRALQEQIATIKTAVIFVGCGGIGPWQDMEVEGLLSEFVRRGCPVIPVVLETGDSVPEYRCS